MRTGTTWAIALLLALVVGGCKHAPAERARVVASIFPLYDLTRRVAGPDADVVLALPPGRTPHGASAPIDPAVLDAKLYVLVGLGLDDWMQPAIASSAKGHALRVGDRVPTRANGDAIDPHVWLDPQRARLIVTAISEELARVDGAHANAYRARAADVDASLASLDAEIEHRMAGVAQRAFVPFHASMSYFAERYHLEALPPIEATPDVPPSTPEANALVATVGTRQLRAVFREPELPAGPAESIAQQARVTVGLLDPLGGTTAETDSYEEILRFDTDALASAGGR